MVCQPSELARILDRLEAFLGPPEEVTPRTALDWVLWENAAYLLDDEKRKSVFLELQRLAGKDGRGILRRPRERLLELAARGGMHPEKRVERWIEIAAKVRFELGGDLESVLDLPFAQARRALARFPGIGNPGAEKILMFTGRAAVPALESNGLRVLVRLGYVDEAKSYSVTYRAAQETMQPFLAQPPAWFARVHQLLRRHGQTLCRRTEPVCVECPLRPECPSAT